MCLHVTPGKAGDSGAINPQVASQRVISPTCTHTHSPLEPWAWHLRAQSGGSLCCSFVPVQILFDLAQVYVPTNSHTLEKSKVEHVVNPSNTKAQPSPP